MRRAILLVLFIAVATTAVMSFIAGGRIRLFGVPVCFAVFWGTALALLFKLQEEEKKADGHDTCAGDEDP